MATLIIEHETVEQNGNICNEDHLIEVKSTDESNTKNTNNEDKVTVDSQLHLKIKMNFVKEKISPTKVSISSPQIASPQQTETHENNNNNTTQNGNHEPVITPTLPKKKRTKQARNNLLEEAESFMQNSKPGNRRSTLASQFAGVRNEDLVTTAVKQFDKMEKEQESWNQTAKYLSNESEREKKLQESKAYWRSVAQSKKRKQCDQAWLDKELEEPGETLVIFDSRTFFKCLSQNAKRAAWEAVQPSKVAQKSAEQSKKSKKS